MAKKKKKRARQRVSHVKQDGERERERERGSRERESQESLERVSRDSLKRGTDREKVSRGRGEGGSVRQHELEGKLVCGWARV